MIYSSWLYAKSRSWAKSRASDYERNGIPPMHNTFTLRIVIVTSTRISVYTLSAQPQKLYSFETIENENGFAALSSSQATASATLVFPGKTSGQLHVVELPLGPLVLNPTTNKIQTPSLSIISAHTSSLAAITVSEDGTLVATASIKGTLVRVFNVSSGKKLFEFRRGMDEAEIYSLHFNRKNTRIVVASDKGTIHVFNLSLSNTPRKLDADSEDPIPANTIENSNRASDVNLKPETQTGNRQSSLAFMAPFLPKYFSSKWSYAYARLPVETRCVCYFSEDVENELSTVAASAKEMVAVVGNDGSFYSLVFDGAKGGQMDMDRFHWYN